MIRWLRTAKTSKWHAWEVGAQHSLCRHLTAADLRTWGRPLDLVAVLAPSDYAGACHHCQARAPLPPVRTEDGVVAQWEGLIGRTAQLRRFRLAKGVAHALAMLLAACGRPDDGAAQEIWEAVRELCLTPVPLRHGHKTVYGVAGLKDGVALLKTPEDLQRVAAAFRWWRRLTRGQTGRYNLQRVVETMLAIPAPEAYVRVLSHRGLLALGVIFHPHTLARAKREAGLRGAFSGSAHYWDTIKQRVVVER